MSYDKETSELAECMKIIFLGPIKNAEEVLRGEVPVLCHIGEKEQITPTELAHKELIIRIHDNKDRRKVYIHLTDAGKQQAAKKAKELYDRLHDLLQALGDEDAKEYLRLTKRVAEYMKQQ